MKIPKKFKSEKEEAQFWDKHSAVDFLKETQEVNDFELSDSLKAKIIKRRQNKVLLTLRVDPDLIEQTKKIAERKAIGYQTLMRMWIADGLDQEKARIR